MNAADPRVQALERSLRITTRLTTALLVLFFLLVAGCAGFVGWQIHRLLNPERVAERSEAYVLKNYPVWKEELQQELVKSAPTLAQHITHRVLTRLPEAREELQDYLDGQIQASMAQDRALNADQFRQLLRDNSKQIQLGLDAAVFTPRLAKRYAAQLEKRIDQQLGDRMRPQASRSMRPFDRINARLARLAQKQDLTPGEEIERRIVRILRAYQVQAGKQVPDTSGE
jgi:hypothetical protein